MTATTEIDARAEKAENKVASLEARLSALMTKHTKALAEARKPRAAVKGAAGKQERVDREARFGRPSGAG